ncbi:MAG: hypothetical protein NC110_02315 [Ruminococcus sp.]|nr:hypothetical protein [Ruminococcus sp.]
MKSYINVLADYREAPFEKEVEIECSKDYVQSQLKLLSKAKRKNEAVSVVEKGDVVVLALESELAKFNRPNVFITVGSNLFDAEFEEMLIGKKSGETFELTVQEKPVKVTIKSATRSVYPEPTDEMVVEYAKTHDDYAELKTVEEYRNFVIDKYIADEKQSAFYDTVRDVVLYVLNDSDWAFDDSEIDELLKEEMVYLDEDLKQEGIDKTADELTDEDCKKLFHDMGVETRADFEDMMRQSCEEQIAMALFYASLSGIDAKSAAYEEIAQQIDWPIIEDYVRENLTITEVR